MAGPARKPNFGRRPPGPRRGVTAGLPTNAGSFKAAELSDAGVTLPDFDFGTAHPVASPSAAPDDTWLAPREEPEMIALSAAVTRVEGASAEPDLIRMRLAAATYRLLSDGREAVDNKIERLASSLGPVTVLYQRGSTVVAAEGRLLPEGRAVGAHEFVEKGRRASELTLFPHEILDIEPGYGHKKAFGETWARRKAQFVPTLAPVTGFEDVNPIRNEKGDMTRPVQAVYAIDPDTGHGPDLPPGTLFLAIDNHTDTYGEESLYGLIWTPGRDGETPTAKGLNFLPGDFLRERAAKVVDYPGDMTIGDALHTMPPSGTEALRRVSGRNWVND